MPAKSIDIKPVTGFMDLRSTADEVAFGGYRYVQNWGVTQKNKLCRVPGWDKFLTRDNYNNQDLHDQLLYLIDDTNQQNPARLPITFLFEAISTKKATKLIAGTENRLYALNMSTGNWKIISDRLGGTGMRWSAAQLDDTVLFTNGLDAVQYWEMDQNVIGAALQSVTTVPDLTTIKVSGVEVIIAWKGCIFLMNLVKDGQAFSNRVIWGDYRKALAFAKTSASVAGDFDLDYGETILAAVPLADSLIIYTNKAIWECQAVGGQEVFSFHRRYVSTKTGESCLAYKNTIVSTGDQHLYMGRDGIYAYDLYLSKPKLVDWIHKASSIIYDDLNKSKCDVHVAAYYSSRKEVWFSWANSNEIQPGKTLVINTEFPFSYILDHGFSAMVTHTVHENILSIRQFILNHCICTQDEYLNSPNGGFPKEGQFCQTEGPVSCPIIPGSFWTTDALTLEDGIETEDYTKVSADADSLCAVLGSLTLSDLCLAEERADECTADPYFIMASTLDYCLKEASQNYYREKLITLAKCVSSCSENCALTGTYQKLGYRSRLLSGPMGFNQFKNDKSIERFELELEPGDQTVPSQVKVSIGTAVQAIDPYSATGKCVILWEEQDAKDLECLGEVTAAQHVIDGTRPDVPFDWTVFREGRYIYFDVEIINNSSTYVDTGGAACLSRISMDVTKVDRSY